MSTTTDERKAEERDDEKRDDEKRDEDGGGKKKRRWLKWVLGAILLVILIVVAVVVLGGSSTTKEPPPPSGSLLAGKQQLLPLSPSGKLNASTGQKVVGKHEIVRSVVRGQGFWVGGSDVDRVFVRYPPAGRNVGAQVALTGTVKPLPINVAKSFGLSRRDAAKVTAEGAYIKATKVSPAGAQP